MGKKRTRAHPQSGAPDNREPSGVARLLAGKPRPGEILALLGIALVIGISAGYLVVHFTRTDSPPPRTAAVADPAAPWRARLVQNPNDVEAVLGLAHVQLDQQQLDEAERLYRQVLSTDAKNVEAITHLGTVFLSRGQADEALRRYDEALRIQPTYVHALWDKANLLQRVKRDYQAAIRTWEAFLQQVGPDSPDGKTAQRFIGEAREAMAKSQVPATTSQ